MNFIPFNKISNKEDKGDCIRMKKTINKGNCIKMKEII